MGNTELCTPNVERRAIDTIAHGIWAWRSYERERVDGLPELVNHKEHKGLVRLGCSPAPLYGPWMPHPRRNFVFFVVKNPTPIAEYGSSTHGRSGMCERADGVGPDLGPCLENLFGNAAQSGVTKVTPYMASTRSRS